MGVMWIVKKHHATTSKRNKMPAVGLLEDRLIEHELCCAVCHNAPGKCDDIVKALRGTGEIVRGCDDRSSACRFGIKDVHDLLLRRWVDAGDRLVKQIDLWVSGDRTRQEDPTTLTTRELADLSPRKVRHVHSRECISNCGVIGDSRPTEWSERGRAPHHHNFAN
jgi:hypothetical protein